jgi:hypothetical protein
VKIRLYGGAGHERMVYLPASVAIAPPQISLPRFRYSELDLLLVLDPTLGGVSAAIAYRDSGVDDPDGYRRYNYVGDAKNDHGTLAS